MSTLLRMADPARAPVILFLHGGGVSSWMWQPVVERLSSQFRCLAPDLPGHGEASGQDFTFAAAVQFLRDLIRTQAPGRRVHAVGLSLGGQTLLHLLAAAPELLDHAIVSGTLTHPLPGFWLYRRMLRLAFPFAHQEWSIRANARALGIPPAFLPQFRQDALRATADGLEAVVAENMSFRLPLKLRTCRTPLLALVGGRERMLLRRCAQDLGRQVPGASAYLVPGAGHTWCLQHPDLFAEVVAAFVRDQPLPSSLVRLR